MAWFVLFLICLICNGAVSLKNATEKFTFLLDEIGSCKQEGVIEFLNLSLSRGAGRKVLINGKIRVNRDIGTSLEHVGKSARCNNKDNPDTCVNFVSMKMPFGCGVLEASNTFWSHFFGNIKPSFKCPIKKGDYTLVNAWFNGSAVPIKGMENFYWKINLTTYELPARQEITCISINGLLH